MQLILTSTANRWPAPVCGARAASRARGPAVAAACIGLAALLSCGGPAKPKSSDLQVLCAVYPAYVVAKEVVNGVPGIQVDLLLAEDAGCPHHYDITPGDRRRLSEANVLVTIGAGFELFLAKTLESAGPSLRVIDSSAGVTLLPGREESGGEPNPHTWVSPRNAGRMARTIAEGLTSAHPSGADAFKRNAVAFQESCERLAGEWSEAARGLQIRRFASVHEIFDYLAADSGFEIPIVLRSSEGSDPTPRRIAEVIAATSGGGAAGILTEPQFPSEWPDRISRETGVPVIMLDPMATGSRDSRYVDVMRANLAKFILGAKGVGQGK